MIRPPAWHDPLPFPSILAPLMLPAVLAISACADEATAPVAPESEASLAAVASAHIGPIGSVVPLVSFDPSAGELPEGLTAARTGELYATLAPRAEVVRIGADGEWSVYATLAASLPEGAPGALGLATDATGRVYAALASFDPATHGVYRIDRSGQATRLPGTEAIGFPNGVALDGHGSLYVTDSAAGAIWRIPPGGAAEVWIQDELLEGTGAFGLGVPIGANGIALGRSEVYTVNSEKGLVLRIPVARDGSAGELGVISGDPEAEMPALFGLDGLERDVHGRLYAVVNIQNRLVRIDPVTGAVTDLATDGLDFPASLTFGTAGGDQKSVFVTNFAFVDTGATAGPGVAAIDVGVPGRPLP